MLFAFSIVNVEADPITNFVGDTFGSLSGPIILYSKEGVNWVACFFCTHIFDLLVYLLKNSDWFYEIAEYACNYVAWDLLCDFALPSVYVLSSFVSPNYACSLADVCPLFDVDKRSYDYSKGQFGNDSFDETPDFFETLSKSNNKYKFDVHYGKQIENFIARIPLEDVQNLEKIFNSFEKKNRDEIQEKIANFRQNVKKRPIQDSLNVLREIIELFKTSLASSKRGDA
ncbi:unnamed protein product [Bursaphelenchus xylophilus]|uniref:(pine wood nematode) hypothetical protein n=1 Tax=Bursaphelenchus xylophilus TaxID=6326 RepID=A0A1I7RJ91_BURXY|nr:unnamed protein product [Bursaphelenchus xylophilus]CAG9119477.1 unnamed protein product [Bursaphelenchus xylophilus]